MLLVGHERIHNFWLSLIQFDCIYIWMGIGGLGSERARVPVWDNKDFLMSTLSAWLN